MNVCILSIVMGKMLQLGKAEMSDLALGAMLHDIGKFQEGESEADYQKHPYESFKWIMKGNEVNHSMLMKGLIALDHHVSFDGNKGFPAFRLGQRPHLYARIVSIADAYDCLTTPVADQEALLPDIALRTILKQAGTIFDPMLAQVFVETLGKYPVGTLVELDSGDLGIVLKSGRSELRVTRPVVLLVRDRFGSEIEGGDIVDLTERHTERKAFKSSIVCSHDPARLGINISGYLIDFLTQTAGGM
jgi:HD-GYP domain-containing protein (c-di-GMP phosphodiesterase class II)